MKNSVLTFIVFAIVSSYVKSQDLATSVSDTKNKALQTSISLTIDKQFKSLHAYTIEYLKIKTSRKYKSWELGGNFNQTFINSPFDSMINISKIRNTHLGLQVWKNNRHIITKNEEARIKFYAGWSWGSMFQYAKMEQDAKELANYSSIYKITLASRFLAGAYIGLSKSMMLDLNFSLPIGISMKRDALYITSPESRKFTDTFYTVGFLIPTFKAGLLFYIR